MDTIPPTFDQLWDQMHGRLCQFVCYRVANPQDAEDILQDVFFRIHRQLDAIRDPRRLESWMYKIARNRIIDHYRSRYQWVDLPESLTVDETVEPDGAPGLIAHLQQSVQALPDAYREALILADYQGLTQQDLAGRLGLSLSGAKSRVQRARQKVKAHLLHCLTIELDTRGQVIDYTPICCC